MAGTSRMRGASALRIFTVETSSRGQWVGGDPAGRAAGAAGVSRPGVPLVE